MVYSAYWRAARALPDPGDPVAAPAEIPSFPYPAGAPPRVTLDELRLRPQKPDWAGGLRASWTPGEAGARKRLDAFLATGIADYAAGRDHPAKADVSRLSAHLRFGEISPRQIVAAIRVADARNSNLAEGADKFLSEMLWREFNYHVLFQLPGRRNGQSSAPFRSDALARSAPARTRRMATRAHRLPAGRRRHARTLGDRLHAQSRAHGRGLVSGQASPDRLARRRDNGSGIRSATPIPPIIRRTGNGLRARAPTPRPTSASSIRCCKARNSTPAATMSAAGFPNSPRCRTNGSTSLGRRRRASAATRASNWADLSEADRRSGRSPRASAQGFRGDMICGDERRRKLTA